jgi:small-conductance mechanosensitive channel
MIVDDGDAIRRQACRPFARAGMTRTSPATTQEDAMSVLSTTYMLPAAAFLTSAAVLLAVRGIAFRILLAWAKRTQTAIDDIVVASLRGPSLFWSVAIAAHLGMTFSSLPQQYIAAISKGIHVVMAFSVTVAVANLSGRLLTSYIRESHLPFKTTGLAYGVAKGIIYIIGLLIILTILGISITPLITALGVGGLAVALALQDTLANLFAGMHILVEKSIRVGDFIRLETGQEGNVQDITWRTTRVRMQQNNVVVIPNSKLAQSVVTNYSLPEKRMAVQIIVGVSYRSDPDRVEQVLVEEAKRAVGQVPGLLGSPEPFARLIPGFGESSLDFTLVCHVVEFADQYPVQHELRKRIFKRFRQEGVEIPFPHRTVFLRQEPGDRHETSV